MTPAVVMSLWQWRTGGFSKKDIRRVVGQLYEVFDLNSVEDAKEKVPFQSLLTSGHIDPKWRKLKGRHLLGAVF